MSESQPTAVRNEDVAATISDLRRVIKEELASVSAPATSITDLMHAIRALHPGASVNAELHGADGWANITVLNLPERLFGSEDLSSDNYPNHYFTRGGYLSVQRYNDGDILAALQTALDLIAEHTAVPA